MASLTFATVIHNQYSAMQQGATLTLHVNHLTERMPEEMKVLNNHIYEYKKGVRRMVLHTMNSRYERGAIQRLESQKIDYIVRPVGEGRRINVFFGRPECLNAIRLIADKPLNELTPEEDFILGTMLGYDLCAQCERYCERKLRESV